MNGGLTVNEVAQAIRDHRHQARIAEANTEVKSCSKAQAVARRSLEFRRELMEMLNEDYLKDDYLKFSV